MCLTIWLTPCPFLVLTKRIMNGRGSGTAEIDTIGLAAGCYAFMHPWLLPSQEMHKPRKRRIQPLRVLPWPREPVTAAAAALAIHTFCGSHISRPLSFNGTSRIASVIVSHVLAAEHSDQHLWRTPFHLENAY
eukprot:TRINITY_DN4034_c0_g2_i6.p1 TRINITY_DN4034_c0_g2~~TRINITY_DN4034_c0_g2_i6.p1  ORF type:complete len:147 (-),score=8.97 TRINITY_DN4034_c0_g2_i6:98-496(-)